MGSYLSALGVATIAFWTIGLVRILVVGRPDGAGAPLSGLVVLVPLTLIVALGTTVVPFIILRAVGLRAGARSWVYFVACGILLGVAETAIIVTPDWLDRQAWARNLSFAENVSLSGALGGLFYWWMAVRKPALDVGSASPPE